ncbi:hypothetical protein [Pseudonocardia sp. DLS-67]
MSETINSATGDGDLARLLWAAQRTASPLSHRGGAGVRLRRAGRAAAVIVSR